MNRTVHMRKTVEIPTCIDQDGVQTRQIANQKNVNLTPLQLEASRMLSRIVQMSRPPIQAG